MTTVIVPEEITIAPPTPLTDSRLPRAEPGAVARSPLAHPPAAIAANPGVASLLQPAWPTNWVNAWIPLEDWGKYNRLGKPVQISSGLAPSYELRTSTGVVTLRMGSRVALCSGLECWLGYAPQIIKGIPCVHWLDAQKSLQPLLNGADSHYGNERVIVLDPGHGGKDSGAKSAIKMAFEKEYTLDWALRLRALLATNGWTVLLTRSNDLDISLPERVALAEHTKADLFLSLHFNSGLPNQTLAGVETYCLTPAGLPSNLIRDYEDNPLHVFPNNAYDEQNFQLACRLHRCVVQSLCAVDRGVRRARFMGVLRGQNRPAVLIEAGYLSNPNEARQVASADYRQKLAEAVARALPRPSRPGENSPKTDSAL